MSAKSPHRRSPKRPVALALKGELTIVEVDAFISQATSVLQAHPDGLRIDCRGLTYVDAAALQALASLRVEAERRGIAMLVDNISESIANDAKLLGMSSILASKPTQVEGS